MFIRSLDDSDHRDFQKAIGSGLDVIAIDPRRIDTSGRKERNFTPEDIANMEDAMQSEGMLLPLLVNATGKGGDTPYKLIDGQLRLTACLNLLNRAIQKVVDNGGEATKEHQREIGRWNMINVFAFESDTTPDVARYLELQMNLTRKELGSKERIEWACDRDELRTKIMPGWAAKKAVGTNINKSTNGTNINICTKPVGKPKGTKSPETIRWEAWFTDAGMATSKNRPNGTAQRLFADFKAETKQSDKLTPSKCSDEEWAAFKAWIKARDEGAEASNAAAEKAKAQAKSDALLGLVEDALTPLSKSYDKYEFAQAVNKFLSDLMSQT